MFPGRGSAAGEGKGAWSPGPCAGAFVALLPHWFRDACRCSAGGVHGSRRGRSLLALCAAAMPCRVPDTSALMA
eukprot:6182051-Pleurochrysis_carterae.AAC.4